MSVGGVMHHLLVSYVGYWCYILVTSVVSVNDVVSDTGVVCHLLVLRVSHRCHVWVSYWCQVSDTCVGFLCCASYLCHVSVTGVMYLLLVSCVVVDECSKWSLLYLCS